MTCPNCDSEMEYDSANGWVCEDCGYKDQYHND